MRYSCIDRRRNQYPVKMMSRLLDVSKSGYYAWRLRPESQRSKQDRELTRLIRCIHIESDGVYGASKITAELKEEGYQCGRHKVARLMRKAGLKGCPKRSFRVTTQRDPSHPVADYLKRGLLDWATPFSSLFEVRRRRTNNALCPLSGPARVWWTLLNVRDNAQGGVP